MDRGNGSPGNSRIPAPSRRSPTGCSGLARLTVPFGQLQQPARTEQVEPWRLADNCCRRVALNMLRARNTRREQPLDVHLTDTIIDPTEGSNPEHEALLADSVGLALLVVLETLTPAERLAFVLHDMFAVPFDEIAPIMERSPEATRQLASRARRRVRGAAPVPDADLTVQWEVAEAFLAAAREGNFDALVAVLDPDVVLRADGGLPAYRSKSRCGDSRQPSLALVPRRLDHATRSSTARPVWSASSTGGRSRSPPSRLRMAKSPRSTSSPTQNASPTRPHTAWRVAHLVPCSKGRGGVTRRHTRQLIFELVAGSYRLTQRQRRFAPKLLAPPNQTASQSVQHRAVIWIHSRTSLMATAAS